MPLGLFSAFSLMSVESAGTVRVPNEPEPGRYEAMRARPDKAEAVACSFRWPICVHGSSGLLPEALRASERALALYQGLGFSLSSDGLRGGNSAYDIYLSAATDSGTFLDAITVGPTDTASAYTVIEAPRHPGCILDVRIARGVAEAIALRLDAGVDAFTSRMFAGYLGEFCISCETALLPEVDDFQRAPDRSFASEPYAGAFLFGQHLEETLGNGAPLVVGSLLGIATQKTGASDWFWSREPDIFDSLRPTLRARKTTLDQSLLDFAVSRAFLGDRSDGAHLQDSARFGAYGRPRFEWSIPYATLPRRLAPLRPIEALGATFLYVDTNTSPPGAEVTIDVEWELPTLFRWALVKVARDGTELGRLADSGIYGSQHAQLTVGSLDGVAGVLIVGTNVGSMDRSHPFDPDERPVPAHNYLMTIAP